MLCVRGPDFAAVKYPAIVVFYRPRADAGQIGSRVGFAHANTKEGLGPADFWQIEFALCLAAITQDQRAALPVGNPVCRYRRTGAQQFFRNDEAGEIALVCAAVLLRQGKAQPPLLRQFFAEVGVKSHPGTGTFKRSHMLRILLDE